MGTVRPRQDGNVVVVDGLPFELRYEIAGIVLPELTDFTFLLWHLLPSAMAAGAPLRIDAPVDPVAIENARRTVRHWELWRPGAFRQIPIEAPPSDRPPPAERRGDLHFFSGGIDSTYMLLERGPAEPRGTAVTVHGMDIKPHEDAQFARNLAKGEPLLAALNYDRITVRSNQRDLGRGEHSWALVLAGYAFLFQDLFERAWFGSDATWEQDMVLFPWGINHVGNRDLRGRYFAVAARNDEVSRAEKVARVAEDPVALSTVSFCGRKAVRPDNCGRCAKCMRTKAMFLGMTGGIPAGVFLDDTFDVHMFDRPGRLEEPDLLDLWQKSPDPGRVPGLDRYVERLRRRDRWSARLRKLARRK